MKIEAENLNQDAKRFKKDVKRLQAELQNLNLDALSLPAGARFFASGLPLPGVAGTQVFNSLCPGTKPLPQ